MTKQWHIKLKKIHDYCWEIPEDCKPGMRVPGRVFISEAMLENVREDNALEQVANVAFLPGIVNYSLAMPDIHWGYGFAIGGVAATRVDTGVVSPGGVGFDINCGVRLLRSNLTIDEVQPEIREIVNALYSGIPSGVGSSGTITVSGKELERVIVEGGRWAVKNGFGLSGDTDTTEENGCLPGANPDKVSSKAKQRGIPQLGTLGSGNHFLEIAVVDEIYNSKDASAMGIHQTGQIVVMIHTGSRGFGHQVCTDYVSSMGNAVKKYGISLPDRQLACAPVESPEGRDYLSAMACAANYAWANRQCIAHWTREILAKTLRKKPNEITLEQVYDVAHNIAKIETHVIDGKKVKLCVHRKGATRAFPAGHPELPDTYRNIGQPVLIPGDMGRYSYIALGTERAMQETFGSTCHGAGRIKSRSAAKKSQRGSDVIQSLENRGIIVRAGSMGAVAEEASEAYKDVAEVIDVTERAGISRKVVKLQPIGVIKG